MDMVNDPAVLALDREYDDEVRTIKSAYDADMAELDAEMDQLEEAGTLLMETDASVQVEVITKNLTNSVDHRS